MSTAHSMRAKDVMSRDVVSISANETLHVALELMGENRVAALPVVDRRDHCLGMLSASDLVDVTRELDDDLERLDGVDGMARGWLVDNLGQGLGNQKIDELMSESVATVGPETPLAEVAREMLRHRVHRLTVTDESDRLVGIVSTMDLLSAFANGASK